MHDYPAATLEIEDKTFNGCLRRDLHVTLDLKLRASDDWGNEQVNLDPRTMQPKIVWEGVFYCDPIGEDTFTLPEEIPCETTFKCMITVGQFKYACTGYMLYTMSNAPHINISDVHRIRG
jgi:hypothetical protein